MIDYPADAGERARLREQKIRDARRLGELEMQRLMRSLNCRTRWEIYGDEHEPCRNDGTACLCGCHDRVTAEVAR